MNRNWVESVRADRDELSPKFWLGPVALAANFGFSGAQLRIEREFHGRMDEDLSTAGLLRGAPASSNLQKLNRTPLPPHSL